MNRILFTACLVMASVLLLGAKFSSHVMSYLTVTGLVDADQLTVNDDSEDLDTRMEGDGDANLFYLDAGNDRIGLGKSDPEQKLEVGGDLLIANDDTNGTNSWKLYLRSDNGGTEQTASLFTAFGADPYLRISAPNDSGTETAVIDVHDTVVSFVTDDAIDIGATGANRPQDIYLSGNLYAEAGEVQDSQANVRYVYPQQIAAAPAEPHDCVAGVRGELIYVDDNDDTAEAYLCFCGVDADDSSYEWFKVSDPTVNCF